MLMILSPAKSLDMSTDHDAHLQTQPAFMSQATELVEQLRQYSPAEIASLMHVSDKLAVLNAERYASWESESTLENARQAVLAFSGDVYQGLDAPTLDEAQLDYLQDHVRILSGLYGVLRPMDLMQPYRLEMGTRLANARGKDLYAFWGSSLSESLDAELQQQVQPVLVNLASEEYFKAVKSGMADMPVVTPVFQDWSGGKYKVVAFHAKKARGMMARYAAVNNVQDVEALKQFDSAGYEYDDGTSDERTWVFRRRKT